MFHPLSIKNRIMTYPARLVQLEFDFDSNSEQHAISQPTPSIPAADAGSPQSSADSKLCQLIERTDRFLLQAKRVLAKIPLTLPRYVFRAFYVEGKSVGSIYEELARGVAGIRPVTQERVRLLVCDLREELLDARLRPKLTSLLPVDKQLMAEIAAYSETNDGEVLCRSPYLQNVRLYPITYLLRRKVYGADTTLPWMQESVYLLHERIEKRTLNYHLLSLFYLLQKEVRPLAFDDILMRLPQQSQWKGEGDADVGLVRLLLSNSELFDWCGGENFQLGFRFLNKTQMLARIIYEQKDLTKTELLRIYKERSGKDTCGSTSSLTSLYPWCVPLGKSKWLYKEDGVRVEGPADVIRRYCYDKGTFTFDELQAHLHSQDININPTSVRCYALKHCRRLNADANLFRLTTQIPPEEDRKWYSKSCPCVRNRKHSYDEEQLRNRICDLLDAQPDGRMLQQDVLHRCLDIFEESGVSRNNFYKAIKRYDWLRVEREEGDTYLYKKEAP